MGEILTQDIAITVSVGPFLDKTDGVTPEIGLAGSMIAYLSKNGGSFAARSSVGAITYDRDGFYKIPLNATDTATLGRLRLEVTSAGTHLPVWEIYQVVTLASAGLSGELYASAANVLAFKVSGETIDLSAYSTAEIEEDINLASRFIDSICNDIFYADAKTFFLDGNGMGEIFFFPDVVARAISLTSVQEMDDDGSTVLRTYTEDTDFKLYDYYMSMFRSLHTDRPRLSFGQAGSWPRGIKNLKIVGSFGRATVPAEIKRAAILLTLERLMPGSTEIAPKDVTQVVWSDFTISYRGSVDVGQTTGFPEVDRLLMQHLNIVDTFLAVPDDRTMSDTYH